MAKIFDKLQHLGEVSQSKYTCSVQLNNQSTHLGLTWLKRIKTPMSAYVIVFVTHYISWYLLHSSVLDTAIPSRWPCHHWWLHHKSTQQLLPCPSCYRHLFFTSMGGDGRIHVLEKNGMMHFRSYVFCLQITLPVTVHIQTLNTHVTQ